MRSLLATERPAGYELRGKGRPEAKRRGRFGVCQVGRGRTAGNSAARLPSSVPAVVKVLRYSTLAAKWLLPSARCPVLSRTPPPNPAGLQHPAPCHQQLQLLSVLTHHCSVSVLDVALEEACSPVAGFPESVLSLIFFTGSLASTSYRSRTYGSPFQVSRRLTTHPLSPWGRAAWVGLTQRDSDCVNQRQGLTWGRTAALGRLGVEGDARSSDLVGGHSPEVQVRVAGGGVQPILRHIAMHVFWGCLRQELVQALPGRMRVRGGHEQEGTISAYPSTATRPLPFSFIHSPIYSPSVS